MSHLEFGGCLADPMGLKNRYVAIRALEDGVRNRNDAVERVRFANYYTSSTGRTKEAVTPAPVATPIQQGFDDTDIPKPGPSSGHGRRASASSYNTASSMADMEHIPADPMTDDDGYHGEPSALHIVETDELPVFDGRPPPGLLTNEKVPFEDAASEKGYSEKGYSENPSIEITRQDTVDSGEAVDVEEPQLAPISPPPEEPPVFDYSQIPDAAVRKAAEKEAARVRKRYEKAVKEHAKAIKDREKVIEKMEKRKGKGAERGIKEMEKKQDREERERQREERQKEKEKEKQEREREREEREAERERERQERETEREKERQERERRRSQGKEESTQEKQELERLRKEQERMDAEYRRMNGIPEPLPPAPLSPRQLPRAPQSPRQSLSTSSSHSHLPLPSVHPAASPSRSSPYSSQQHCKYKKKRERRFCILPRDKSDKCWVKVEMKGVDEVGAHCGLFFVGEVYERLVGDVAARIEEWVGDETSRRLAEE